MSKAAPTAPAEVKFYGSIRRVDEEERMVWGYAATEQRALDGMVVTRGALEGALDEYMQWANIREMHGASAAGVAREAHVDEAGLYIGAHVVDDSAWKKVVSRVYKGFSIGAKITERDKVDRTKITAVQIREISLVDRPSDPGAVFDVWRAAAGGAAVRAPTEGEIRKHLAALPAAERAHLLARAALKVAVITPRFTGSKGR